MNASTPDIVVRAVALSDTICQVARRRPFELAVREFAQLLTTVPDYPPGDFSVESIELLAARAEDVISRIEQRVSAGEDPDGVQLVLVSAVYDIRRSLEEIDRWRRHFHRRRS